MEQKSLIYKQNRVKMVKSQKSVLKSWLPHCGKTKIQNIIFDTNIGQFEVEKTLSKEQHFSSTTEFENFYP